MKTLLPFLVLIALSACVPGLSEEGTNTENTANLQEIALLAPDGRAVKVLVDVADTQEEQRVGLQGRTFLEDDHGMLFLFDTPAILSFWMKDTYVPLDIIFFDPQGKWVSHGSMSPCEEDPCPQYQSEKPASIALEVNAGFVSQLGIGEGWQIALPIE